MNKLLYYTAIILKIIDKYRTAALCEAFCQKFYITLSHVLLGHTPMREAYHFLFLLQIQNRKPKFREMEQVLLGSLVEQGSRWAPLAPPPAMDSVLEVHCPRALFPCRLQAVSAKLMQQTVSPWFCSGSISTSSNRTEKNGSGAFQA